MRGATLCARSGAQVLANMVVYEALAVVLQLLGRPRQPAQAAETRCASFAPVSVSPLCLRG